MKSRCFTFLQLPPITCQVASSHTSCHELDSSAICSICNLLCMNRRMMATSTIHHHGLKSADQFEAHATVPLSAAPTSSPNRRHANSVGGIDRQELWKPSISANRRHANPAGGIDRQELWNPSINRNQSWNEQDMKHQLQNRLLQTEQGKESGFTELKP
jgi:hypothetical protein